MTPIRFSWRHAASLAVLSAFVLTGCGAAGSSGDKAEAGAANDEHGAEGHSEAGHGEEGHGEEHGADRVTIPAEAQKVSDIGVTAAGPGALRETLSLSGRLMLQPAARAEIHAPYPGPVRAVLRNVGETVRKGETLARIESAESLQTYAVSSPISGVVLERETNIGDVTGGDPLFVVGDLSRLQAELNVVSRDVARLASGQTVEIASLDGGTRVDAKIASVLPMADAHSQTLIARAPVTVSPTTPLRPGIAIRGAVVLAEENVAIAVPADAVQTVEGKTTVFVRVTPEAFEARPVTIGRRSATLVEITGGLAAGEPVVTRNAFLVKAEMGKGSASHDH